MTPEEKRAMIRALLAGGMPEAGGSPLRQRKAMEDAQMKQRHLADTFMAAQADPLESLLMQGDMTPGQMYANAAGNDAPGSGPAAWARERAMAGNTVAQAPFDPLEALSAQQAMEQALMGSESRAPATSPRPRPAPFPGYEAANDVFRDVRGGVPMGTVQGGMSQYDQEWANDMPSGFASVFSDLSPQERQGIIGLMKQGAPVDQAFDAVLGIDMNAISRGQ